MKLKIVSSFICILLLFHQSSFSQNCPENIGFELGSFLNWKSYSGFVAKASNPNRNVITLAEGQPVNGRHTIMTSKTQLDKYGNFPVLAPNGSGFSVKLGNDGTQKNAEGLSYRFRVPVNNAEFILSYQYAVVFQDPNHPAYQQPRFNAKVLDVELNQYIQCASFEYIATSSLPGFKRSSVGANVLYKDWTTVTLNLSGYQGKELLLEFTTADCTEGAHFGYAYVDVNEQCQGVINGNEICANATKIALAGPAGYKDYVWYNADRSIRYGDGENFIFNTMLDNGTKILLDLTPYDGYGCPNTVSTVIIKKDFKLELLSEKVLCAGTSLNLLAADIILNKETSVNYTCYEDASLSKVIVNPNYLIKSGIYYVKAVSNNGCTDVKSIKVLFNDHFANVQSLSDIKICKTEFADLTATNVLAGLPTGAVLSYYHDRDLRNLVIDASRVGIGDYFIKIQKDGCHIVKQVNVSNYPEPILKITNPPPFCLNSMADITKSSYYAGSTGSLSYTYFNDLNLTSPLTNPQRVSVSGRYYVKATNSNGCSTVGFMDVVFDNPKLLVKNPVPVCFPQTVDITDLKLYEGSTTAVTYKYYNADGSLVPNPAVVSKSGKYLVEIINTYGCSDKKEIQVQINNHFANVQSLSDIKICKTEFADLTATNVLAGLPTGVVLSYYHDRDLRNLVIDASRVGIGDYFIKIQKDGCHIVKQVNVSNYPEPILKITNPPPFCLNSMADITKSSYYAGSTGSLSYTYFNDLNLTSPLTNPQRVSVSGRYYVKATNSNGCSTVGFMDVVFDNPKLLVKNPVPVCFPQTVDITDLKLYEGSTTAVTYKYYNADGSLVPNPAVVSRPGKYFVEIINTYGCNDRKEVQVQINPLPQINIVQPKKILEPKTIDLTEQSVTRGSSGFQKVEYYEDPQLMRKLANPNKIEKSGSYYIVLYSQFGCQIKGQVNVVIGKKPAVVVPTAFTPLNDKNNKLYPFLVSIKKLVSFKVYNKWGNLVFQTNSNKPQDGWDGYYKGKLQPYETYTWYVEALDEIDEVYQSTGKFVMML